MNSTIENVCASNWRIIITDITDFNKVCYFVINEFFNADIIKINKYDNTIRIHFPSSYSYANILRKICQYRNQIIIEIDEEKEAKLLVQSLDYL